MTGAELKLPSESEIKRDIVHFLKLNGVLCWTNISTGIYDPKRKIFRKMNGYGMRKGVADILGIYKGKFLAIEVKSKRGVPTEEQLAFLEDVNRHNGIGFVARSLTDVSERLFGKKL